MAFQLVRTEKFKKQFKKFSAPERKQIANKLVLLSQNPNHPSLRTKPVQGVHKIKLYESSMNMDLRVLWFYEGSQIIILSEVGHHDIFKKF